MSVDVPKVGLFVDNPKVELSNDIPKIEDVDESTNLSEKEVNPEEESSDPERLKTPEPTSENKTRWTSKNVDEATVKILEDVLEEPCKNWKITGGSDNDKEHPDLYMVHSKLSSNQNIRGKIVDVKNKVVVCTSLGYPSELVISDLVHNDEYGFCAALEGLEEHDSNMISLEEENCDVTLHISLEGPVIRVFKHDGVVRYSSHRKINCDNSRCGN